MLIGQMSVMTHVDSRPGWVLTLHPHVSSMLHFAAYSSKWTQMPLIAT